MQTSGLGVLTTDRALVVLTWNAWLEAATGITEAHARGRHLLDLISPERRDVCQDVCAEVLSTGATRVLAPAFHHYLFRCPPVPPSAHFEHMQQRVTVAPLAADASIAGIMITIEDVTAALDEQRALAARLQSQAADAGSRDALAGVGAQDWRVRGAAVTALKQAASSDDLAHLLDSFERQHQDLNLLSGALQVLIASNRDVVPPLVALLSDSHANLRMHAALALGELQDADAVPALLRALDDEDVNVRFHVIEALGRMARPEAVEPLARIAESGDFFLAFPAIDALAKTDDPRVVSSLLGLLNNELLRPAAIDAIAALGDEECVPALVDLINTGGGDLAPVSAALDRIRHRYDETFGAGEQIVDLVRTHISPAGVGHLADAVARRETPLAPLVVVLGWTGAPALAALVGLVGERAVEAETTSALAAMGREATMPLLERLGSGDRAARLAVVSAIARLNDPRAIPALTDQLRSPDTELVAAAASALAALSDPAALDSLLSLFGHERAAVRQAAVAGVNSIGTGATSLRIRACLEDEDPRVRESAIRVAGYFGFEDCVPRILESLDDADEDVRRAAIEQLAIVDHPQAAARLQRAIASETARNRAAAAHAARAADDPSLDAPLVAALADPHSWVRYFAADSLGQRRTAGAARALIQAAESDDAPQVRIAAMRAIGAIDADAVLPVAEQVLREADDDLAAAALAALAASRDPAADDLLAQASRSTSPARQGHAVQALALRPTVSAVAALAWAARLTDAPQLAALGVSGLAGVAAASSVPVVTREAVDALFAVALDATRRAEVVAALSRLTGPAIDLVAEALADIRPAVRIVAADALARMRHPRASRALLAALDDADSAVRSAAVSGFGRLGTPAASARVVELRDRDPDPAVRRRASLVCQRHGWQA